ncbi:MAG TPA: hypothetical protein VFW11_07115 [Cyclobacteriaceae bacterium]|nr:hypothetical protein [Cyclobacteriaceae bacterium]
MDKKSLITLPICILITVSWTFAQWPKEITTKGGTLITVYQPQPESMKGSVLDGRAAFSVQEKSAGDLIFGVFWYTAIMVTDRDTRSVTLESITVNDVKLPGVEDTVKIEKLKSLLETEIPKWQITASLDDIISTIEEEQAYVSDDLKNDPPEIKYVSLPTTLVLIDGEPKLQDDKELKMKRVINSAFLIVQNPEDKRFYLYGGQFWYSSASMTEGYQHTTSLPKSITALDQQLKKQQTEKKTSGVTSPPAIMVSTTPAELIQSKGQADFANIPGTNLLYMSNSDDDIFRSIDTSQYYVLLSGRWYASQKLAGPWKYISSDKLPGDFAKIPEGSPKDNVLASIAGTQASKDAIRDAQVPQTAKVDRKTATCTVTYDGDPKFEKIEGTSLELAMNTSSTVLKSGKDYYCVDKGVWFVSSSAKGPWKVSDERPKDVDKIPASSTAYNVKYVYIYDSTPEVVYVGYTPGYMGCYVYGPTVVYGTGYYYSPWYGPYYYPRPATYGFSMHYNPWTGWSMGFHYSSGWFSFSMYGGGGYWGPPVYRPPYYPPYRGGMYGGRGPTYINGDVNINIDRSNNIYNNRKDVTTRDVKRGQANQPGVSTRDQTRQGTQPGVSTRDQTKNQTRQPSASQQPAAANRNKGDVYSDRNGNVYQRNNDGNWSQRDGNQWKQTQQSSQMNRDYENRQRSTQQNSNFQQMNRGGNLGGSYRGGGGMGGGRRR